jgi:hypothetical protein
LLAANLRGMMRANAQKVAALIALLVIALSLAVLYRRHEATRAHLRRERQAAEMVWQEFVTVYQRDVPLGTARSEVKKYLDGQKARYIDGRNIMVRLGETPDDGLFCAYRYVYASFDFSPPQNQTDPSPLAKLTGISLKRVGHCL